MQVQHTTYILELKCDILLIFFVRSKHVILWTKQIRKKYPFIMARKNQTPLTKNRHHFLYEFFLEQAAHLNI